MIERLKLTLRILWGGRPWNRATLERGAIEERAAIVMWLRDAHLRGETWVVEYDIADQIEREDHLRTVTPKDQETRERK